jgi:hypothetical protein
MEMVTDFQAAMMGFGFALLCFGSFLVDDRNPPKFGWKKVGGLTFVRVGRLSVSFCICKK